MDILAGKWFTVTVKKVGGISVKRESKDDNHS